MSTALSTEGRTRFDLTSTEPLPATYKLRGMQHAGKHGWSYSGIAWTDRDGRAVVNLPVFARLHDDGFEYELETIDSPSRVELAKGVIDGRFTVVTDQPHVKVSWRLTAYRAEGDESPRR